MKNKHLPKLKNRLNPLKITPRKSKISKIEKQIKNLTHIVTSIFQHQTAIMPNQNVPTLNINPYTITNQNEPIFDSTIGPSSPTNSQPSSNTISSNTTEEIKSDFIYQAHEKNIPKYSDHLKNHPLFFLQLYEQYIESQN